MKTITPSDVYRAETKTVLETLLEYRYLPAFQREYTWGDDSVRRLIADILDGVRGAATGVDENRLVFLGAVIVVAGSVERHVTPKSQGGTPKSFGVLIDGQQRCITLTLLLVSFLGRLYKSRKELADVAASETQTLTASEQRLVGDLGNRVQKLIDSIHSTIQHKEAHESDYNHGFYPRMIREGQDCWSRHENEKKYNSPEARFQLAVSTREPQICDSKALKKWLSKERHSSRDISLHDAAFKVCVDEVDEFLSTPVMPTKARPEDRALLSAWGENYDVVYANLPEQVRKASDLSLMVDYALNRTVVTRITADTEDRAFELFDALNTTGEPLTAYETFRPLAMNCDDDVWAEMFHREVRLIDAVVPKDKRKTKFTQSMLTHHALLWAGEKLGSKLWRQRSALRAYWGEASQKEIREECNAHRLRLLKALKCTALSTWIFTDKAKGNSPPQHAKCALGLSSQMADSPAGLAIEWMRLVRHDVVAPMFAKILDYHEGDFANAHAHIGKMLRICLSFSVLWRAGQIDGGTAGVDDCYRRRFAEGPGRGVSSPDDWIKECATGLWAELRRIYKSASEWRACASSRSVGKNAALAKILLAAAYSEGQGTPTGVVRAERATPCDYLRDYGDWFHGKGPSAMQLEHVMPQSAIKKSGGADPSEVVQCLGNLTMLQEAVNTSLKDAPWKDKRCAYGALSGEIQRSQASEFPRVFGEQHDKRDHFFDKNMHNPFVVGLSAVDEWTVSSIQERSAGLARAAFSRLVRELSPYVDTDWE